MFFDKRASFLAMSVIFFAALVLRIAFIFFYDHHKFLSQGFFSGDSLAYVTVAQNILHGKGIVLDDYLKARIAPVYPIFLALMSAMFGNDMVVVRFAQALLGALSCVVLYAIVKRLFDQKTAFFAGMIMACYYPCVQMPAYVMTEELNLFLFLVTLFAYVSLAEFPGVITGLICGFFYGVSALCKGVLFGFIPFFAASLFVCLRQQPLHKRIGYTLLVMLAIGATMTPWALRNYRLYKAFVPVTVVSGDLFYKGNSGPNSGGSGGLHVRGVNFPELNNRPAAFNEVEADRFFNQQGMRYLKEHPRMIPKLAIDKFWNMWRPYHAAGSRMGKIIMLLQYLPLVIGAMVGFFMSIRDWRKLLLFYFFLAFMVAVHLVLIGIIRYRYLAEPVLIVFAAYALAAMVSPSCRQGDNNL